VRRRCCGGLISTISAKNDECRGKNFNDVARNHKDPSAGKRRWEQTGRLSEPRLKGPRRAYGKMFETLALWP